MKYVTFLKDLFESNPDYKKIVLLLFLVNNDIGLLGEYGFLKVILNV